MRIYRYHTNLKWHYLCVWIAWFEFAKVKSAKIILQVNSPTFRAAKLKGFTVICVWTKSTCDRTLTLPSYTCRKRVLNQLQPRPTKTLTMTATLHELDARRNYCNNFQLNDQIVNICTDKVNQQTSSKLHGPMTEDINIDWVEVLHPTRHKIGHSGNIPPSQSLKQTESKQQKQTCKYTTT